MGRKTDSATPGSVQTCHGHIFLAYHFTRGLIHPQTSHGQHSAGQQTRSERNINGVQREFELAQITDRLTEAILNPHFSTFCDLVQRLF